MSTKRRLFFAALIIPLVLGLTAVIITGAWVAPLRAVGLLAPLELEVTYINVGDMGPDHPGVVGDSILLRSSEGRQVLIDGGFPNGSALAYLQAHNVDHLDLVVLTHAHDDHTGGLIEILKNIPVDLLVYNGQPLDSPIFAELEAAIGSQNVTTRVVKAGDTLPFGSLKFQVLSPRKINPDSINNNSVVLRLVNGKVSFLFTGDTQHLEEARLVASGVPLQADIFKIPHHGADSSSSMAFLVEVAPTIAIYSVGTGNMYDFPHAVTLENLDALGTQVFGTDVNGTVTVITDGKTYSVNPERGGPLE
jgi:competence protein ComEC